jgi:hypothetical protein
VEKFSLGRGNWKIDSALSISKYRKWNELPDSGNGTQLAIDNFSPNLLCSFCSFSKRNLDEYHPAIHAVDPDAGPSFRSDRSVER